MSTSVLVKRTFIAVPLFILLVIRVPASATDMAECCNRALHKIPPVELTKSTVDIMNNGYTGISISGSVVRQVFPGSAAEKCGIKSGDKILAINGKSTENKNRNEMVRMLVGPIGTTVAIKARRHGKSYKTILVRARPVAQQRDFLEEQIKKDRSSMLKINSLKLKE